MAQLRLSVIIPVFNAEKTLPRCIGSLNQAQRAPDQIILVDDGSTDGCCDSIVDSNIEVLKVGHGPAGPAHARNIGADAADGDILVFIDSDITVHDSTLKLIEKEFEADLSPDALFGSYDDSPDSPGVVSQYKNLLHHYVHQQAHGQAATFWSGCGAIKREHFKAVGGFDEKYSRPSIEDIDLGYRLSSLGRRINLCSHIQVKHLKHWTLWGMIETDIFARAIPWTKLLLSRPDIPMTLNTDHRARLSALFAWIMLASLFAVPWQPLLALPAFAAMVLVWLLNRSMFGFFRKRHGARFVLAVLPLHMLYLLYSSLIFGIYSIKTPGSVVSRLVSRSSS